MKKEKAIETTENYHRIPVANKKKGAKIRTISISKGIKALYDVTNKTIVTYLFDRDQYTMKQAKEWVKKHKDNAEIALIVANYRCLMILTRCLDQATKKR
jgi:hypothetical protein